MEFAPGSPAILLDALHNPAGAEALAYSLDVLFPGVVFVFVMAVLIDRDIAGILTPLMPSASAFIFTRPSSSRVPPHSPNDLVDFARARGKRSRAVESPSKALEAARELAGPEEIACVCGSLSLVGEIWAELHPEDRGDL